MDGRRPGTGVPVKGAAAATHREAAARPTRLGKPGRSSQAQMLADRTFRPASSAPLRLALACRSAPAQTRFAPAPKLQGGLMLNHDWQLPAPQPDLLPMLSRG